MAMRVFGGDELFQLSACGNDGCSDDHQSLILFTPEMNWVAAALGPCFALNSDW
jgi:hypothetical protein